MSDNLLDQEGLIVKWSGEILFDFDQFGFKSDYQRVGMIPKHIMDHIPKPKSKWVYELVTIDGLSDPVGAWCLEGDNWNGFLKPHFTEESVQNIIDQFSDNDNIAFEFSSDLHRVFFTNFEESPNHAEVFIRTEIKVSGQTIEVFDLKNNDWCWELHRPNNSDHVVDSLRFMVESMPKISEARSLTEIPFAGVDFSQAGLNPCVDGNKSAQVNLDEINKQLAESKVLPFTNSEHGINLHNVSVPFNDSMRLELRSPCCDAGVIEKIHRYKLTDLDKRFDLGSPYYDITRCSACCTTLNDTDIENATSYLRTTK